MKHTFKILICLMLIVSLLAFGACNKDGGKTESVDSTDSADISAESTDTSTESSEDSSAEESAEADEALIGTWYVAKYSLMFKEGGTGVYCVEGELIPITWETKDGKLSVKAEMATDPLPEDESYNVSEDGKTLTIGETVYSNEPVEVSSDIDLSLVGTWYNYSMDGEETTVFNADGSGTITMSGLELPMTWSVKDGILSFSIDMGDALSTDMTADSYRIEGDTLYLTIMGEEGVHTKTRRELGGNESLCGTWIEPDAPIVDDYPDYGYSITFNSDGTGDYSDYTDEDEYASYDFIWSEADGTISFDIYTVDFETFEEKMLTTVNASYTIDSEGLILTLTDGSKKTSFEFYEEEFDFDFDMGFEVDTEHELGGDNALVGEWFMEEAGEAITVTITADGTFKMSDDSFVEMDYVWYAEDGFIVVYGESMGIVIPIVYGDYKVDGDLFTINSEGEYSALARKGSGINGYSITVNGTEMDWVDPETSIFFEEEGGSECIEMYISSAVKDCKFVQYGYDEDYVGYYTACVTLYTIPTLAEDECFVALTTINTEVPYRGISFTSPDGKTVYLGIEYDEDTEAYNFFEIDPLVWEN